MLACSEEPEPKSPLTAKRSESEGEATLAPEGGAASGAESEGEATFAPEDGVASGAESEGEATLAPEDGVASGAELRLSSNALVLADPSLPPQATSAERRKMTVERETQTGAACLRRRLEQSVEIPGFLGGPDDVRMMSRALSGPCALV